MTDIDLTCITLQGADNDLPWLACEIPGCHWDSATDPACGHIAGVTVGAVVALAEAHLDTHRERA